MYNTSIKTKIMLSFLGMVIITLSIFSFYALDEVRRYSERHFTIMLFNYAKHSEHIVNSHYGSDRYKWISLLLPNSEQTRHMNIEIIDESGTIVFASNKHISPFSQKNFPEVKQALSGKEGLATRIDSGGEKFFFAAIPLGKPPYKKVLRVSSPDTMSGTVLGDFVKSILAAFLLLLVPVILISSHLSGRLLRPLKKITDAATELSLGHLEHRVNYQNADEFTLLSHTLNKLASGLSYKIKELSSEKQNQQLILEHMDNPIIVTDNTGRIVSINNRGRYVFHHNRNTCLLGKHNLEVVGSSLLDSTIKECLKNTDDATIDLKITRNRTDYVFRVFISPMPSAPRPADGHILCVFHDVTALLGIYERQISFVANASHELSTPLTSIVGFSETLLDGAIESPPLSRKFIGIIHEEGIRMQKIIKDILQLARLDSGEYRQAISISAFAANGFMEKAKKRLSQQIARKKLSVRIVYKQPPGRVFANADWLEQILINLLENAVKYSHDGGKIAMIYDQTDRFAVFSVSDEGIGIKPEQLPFIFERFYRAGKAKAKKTTSGTGLGLAIVKFIVDLFGGTITAESKFNAGSTFIVNIPLASYEDESEAGATA